MFDEDVNVDITKSSLGSQRIIQGRAMSLIVVIKKINKNLNKRVV